MEIKDTELYNLTRTAVEKRMPELLNRWEQFWYNYYTQKKKGQNEKKRNTPSGG